jgi:hypothetical protein
MGFRPFNRKKSGAMNTTTYKEGSNMLTVMESTKTNTVSTIDWLQVTKHMVIHAAPMILHYSGKDQAKNTSHKRKLPVGEHIREAIDIIKQKDE